MIVNVTGTQPIHTTIIRNSIVLVNTTLTIHWISEEGNFTIESTSKYGTEVKELFVMFNGENKVKTETKLVY